VPKLVVHIDHRTNLFVLNNPNNPTGALMDEALLREVVEAASNPQDPYTLALISVIPVPDPRARRARGPQGETPNPVDIPLGCRFHSRTRRTWHGLNDKGNA
jgi:oligopeptide/dipeptide ABC transporter ATP-binding protein